MDEKRYIFETVEITDDNGESRVVDVITDKERFEKMKKYWYCLRHHKQLTNKESKKCKGCPSLSLTLLEENQE